MEKLEEILTEKGENPISNEEFRHFAEFLKASSDSAAGESVDLKHFKEFLLLSGQ